jgi:DNA invertase Pin-like site-specific DNA recombinase
VVVIFAPGRPSLLAYCARRGWEDVAVIHSPEKLMRVARMGKVKVVLASSLSGLARSVQELVAMLRDLVSRRVALIVPGEINTSGVPGKAVLDVLDAIEEF